MLTSNSLVGKLTGWKCESCGFHGVIAEDLQVWWDDIPGDTAYHRWRIDYLIRKLWACLVINSKKC